MNLSQFVCVCCSVCCLYACQRPCPVSWLTSCSWSEQKIDKKLHLFNGMALILEASYARLFTLSGRRPIERSFQFQNYLHLFFFRHFLNMRLLHSLQVWSKPSFRRAKTTDYTPSSGPNMEATMLPWDATNIWSTIGAKEQLKKRATAWEAGGFYFYSPATPKHDSINTVVAHHALMDSSPSKSLFTCSMSLAFILGAVLNIYWVNCCIRHHGLVGVEK